MFHYIDDDKKKSEGASGYGGKSTDEITEDLVKIMSRTYGEEDLSSPNSKKDSTKKIMKKSMGMVGMNDHYIGRVDEEVSEILEEDDNVLKSRKLMKTHQKREKRTVSDGIVFNNVTEGIDSEDLDEEDLDEEDVKNQVSIRDEEHSKIQPISPSNMNRGKKNLSPSKATEKLIKKKKSPVKIALSPVPAEEDLVNCYIIRDKGKLKIFPKYYLYAERGDEDVFLMAAKKRGSNKTSNYCVCTNKNVERSGPNYIGKLRSNILGTKFYIYDKGEREDNTLSVKKPVRKQLGAVVYEANILGTKGPRKMTAIIPKVNEDGRYKKFYDKKGHKLIDVYQKNGDWQDIHIFKNKGPTWNEALKAYVLNFNGRVTKPSVKNFQLVDPHNKDLVMLQFGRVSEHKFTLDFRYPLSPFQAFTVALSAFDIKIACE